VKPLVTSRNWRKSSTPRHAELRGNGILDPVVVEKRAVWLSAAPAAASLRPGTSATIGFVQVILRAILDEAAAVLDRFQIETDAIGIGIILR